MLTGSYRSYLTLETLRAGSLDESVQIRPLAVGLVYLRQFTILATDEFTQCHFRAVL